MDDLFVAGETAVLRIRRTQRGALNHIADYIRSHHGDFINRADSFSIVALPGMAVGDGDPLYAEIFIRIDLASQEDILVLQEIVRIAQNSSDLKVEVGRKALRENLVTKLLSLFFSKFSK